MWVCNGSVRIAERAGKCWSIKGAEAECYTGEVENGYTYRHRMIVIGSYYTRLTISICTYMYLGECE